FDEIGSTRLLTDTSGNVTDKYCYDVYGATIAHNCSTGSASQPYQYVGKLGYYTYYQEPDFGLLQLGLRYLEPETGVFTQRDIAHRVATSSYLYADNQSLVLVDPKGMLPTISCSKKSDPKGKVKKSIGRICNALKKGKMNKCGGCDSDPDKLKCLKEFCSQGKIECDGHWCRTDSETCGWGVDADGGYNPGGKIDICMKNGADDPAKCDNAKCATGQPLTLTILHEMMHLCGNMNDDDSRPNSADNQAADCIRKALQ
ncbi:MAG: hypothetical protein PHV74_16155, partial [Dehalococcoidia bacterium]|nr:hypothetical protein [Dehalococcoidia bacterium]